MSAPALAVNVRICESPLQRGPGKGQSARGTRAGWQRHYAAGEQPCEPCANANRAHASRWQKANPDKRAAYLRDWRQHNPDSGRDSVKRWREANRTTFLDYQQRYYQEHRARRARYEREWSRANPDKRADIKRRRRARRQDATVIPYSSAQLALRLSMFAGCWLCGGQAGTVDHVKPLAKGGADILANLRPACMSCNARKSARWPLDVAR